MSLTNDAFLVELGNLYTQARLGGPKSVYVTMKSYDGRAKPLPHGTEPSTENAECLVRAKLGNKKISTAVAAKDVNKFHQSYVGVLRTSIDNLERRKKTEEESKKKAKTSPTKGTKA